MPCLEVIDLDGVTRKYELTEHGAIFERRFSPLLENVVFREHIEIGDGNQDDATDRNWRSHVSAAAIRQRSAPSRPQLRYRITGVNRPAN
jgi:hypothetical protein